ncbi:MAG: FAD-binding domain-containing protein [Pseudomonadota bacterium]
MVDTQHLPNLQVVWFKRDLRVHDNEALTRAAQAGPVLPLFIVEPDLYRQPDAAGRHWAFLRECLDELSEELARLGQPLIIKTGDAVRTLQDLHRRHPFSTLWSHQETGNGWTFDRDKRVARWCRTAGVSWQQPRQFGVVRRLRNRNGWAAAWDKQMAMPKFEAPRHLEPLSNLTTGIAPSSSELGLAKDCCPYRQHGGRSRGLDVLHSFLFERGRDYRRGMSSPVTGFDACSRLSAHLAYGSLSMREIAQATYNRQRELKEAEQVLDVKAWRASLASYAGRLHWHCHFIQKLEDEPAIEFKNLHTAYDGMRPEEPDQRLLQAWAMGETGFPFVDACMRALCETGWLNFRMRAMLMSFASYQLWLPWRESGRHLARLFTDYEPGIHWPQSQMQSGTTGINTVRIYNPVKQSEDQDPTGQFIRRLCPELGSVPDAFIHRPWNWPGFESEVGGSYPRRIVDPLFGCTRSA